MQGRNDGIYTNDGVYVGFTRLNEISALLLQQNIQESDVSLRYGNFVMRRDRLELELVEEIFNLIRRRKTRIMQGVKAGLRFRAVVMIRFTSSLISTSTSIALKDLSILHGSEQS